MKKTLCLLLLPLLFLFSACGGGEQGGHSSLKERVFRAGEMEICLDESFAQAAMPGYDACYTSEHVDVFALREAFTLAEGLEDMTLSEFDELEPDLPTGGLVGSISTNETWYYVCAVPETYLETAYEGQTVSVSFAAVGDPIDMVISRIGQAEDGRCLLVLSSRRYLSKIAALREQSAQVVFQTYSGLRVPKSSICYEDGETGVYIVESTYAKWKKVEILYDAGESYVVKLDKSSTSNLWAGDEIIVVTRDLYNGKVVR